MYSNVDSVGSLTLLRHTVDSFQSWPEKINIHVGGPYVHVGGPCDTCFI